ncbi:class I SAM-dependent methyltransferase [Demetria terragena]|uniref:class I SAM-dependent methyltransferase n=1 Tax=Demetria terragena TaxID=63959 RepID=UPI00036E47F2|nr:class I SAM-dependent methyltransferase [Demetria terragena]
MTTKSPEPLTPARAQHWLRRWDDQQATFFTDREERFQVICDVLEETLSRPDPLIVDLGVGPGSLSQRILGRIPNATIVGADMDPLLLGLAESAYGNDRFRVVQVDLRSDRWVETLGLDRAPDAFVSTTALHWLERIPLQRLVVQACEVLAPGGVFIDGDHLYAVADRTGVDALSKAVARRAAERVGRVEAEDWATWWRAVEAAPELASLWAARDRTDLEHTVNDRPTVADYLEALREGGCDQVGQVWQIGDDRVIVGRRPR